MARGKICDRCKSESPGDSMFCMECGEHLEKTDRFAIEKKMEKAHCQACGHYNPIERTRCESCGVELGTGQGAVFRDEHGRLRLLRPAEATRGQKVFLGGVILGLLLSAGRILWTAWVASRGATDRLMHDPVAMAAAGFLVVAFLVLVNRGTDLGYKTKALFGLALCGAFVCAELVGPERAVWPQFTMGRALLWMHTLALAYCLFFLIYSQFLGSLFTALFCLVGLWCAYASWVGIFQGSSYAGYLAGLGTLGNLPLLVTPGFLTFNLFLPYVFLQMVGHFFAQLAVNRRYVVTTDTDKAVLREARSRNLRGVFLNLFVAGTVLASGLWNLHKLSRPNLGSVLWDLVAPLVASLRG